jgi:hypothetical protein
MRSIYTLHLLLAGLLLVLSSAKAQTQRAVVQLEGRSTVSIPLEGITPFLAFSAKWEGSAHHITVRFSADGSRWGDWQTLEQDQHGMPEETWNYSSLHFAPKESQWVQIQHLEDLGDTELHFFNPGDTKPKADQETTTEPVATRTPTFCPCPLGDFEDRDEWCPSGTCPEDTTPAPTSVTHLIVHHSAGTNQANDWAAVVRSIWDFHVLTRGWDDIGYNWLIDPNGVLYQGRGDNVRGAHFCGNNTGTMGVCVMGDFTAVTPADEAKDALARLLAWKSCDINADPLGTAYHASSDLQLMNISGHRDGCSTSCPGDAFYPQLPAIRQAVVDLIATQCAAIAAPGDLEGEVSDSLTILLNWVDNSDDEINFMLERALSLDGAYAQIAELDADVTTYEDTEVSPAVGYYYRVRNTNGVDTSGYSNTVFVYTSLVNTSEQLLGQEVQLFPNPVQDVVELRWASPLAQPIQVRLLDLRGSMLTQWTLDGQALQHQLDVQGFPAGVYIMQLQAGGQQVSKRLVKE